MSGPTVAPGEVLDSAAGVLGFARENRAVANRAVANRAEANVLLAAVTWAEQHPPASIGLEAAWVLGSDEALTLAGEGAPQVAEFCLAEFASALGVSGEAGRGLVAAAIELKYRLPKVWSRVQEGTLTAWKARRIAERTWSLSSAAAGFVDAQVAFCAHRISFAAVERLVEEACARLMPEQARSRAEAAAEGRHVRFFHDHVSSEGTTAFEGVLDLADALDLDAALSQGAEVRRLLGSTESTEVRRAQAAGDLARAQLALALDRADAATPVPDPPVNGSIADPDAAAPAAVGRGRGRGRAGRARGRQVVLYVHLSQDAVTSADRCREGGGLELARVENHRRIVTADQVKAWCADPETQVVLKPVIDLADHVRADAYEIPDRLKELVDLRDGACVFPWCSRRARACDHDHVVPHAQTHDPAVTPGSGTASGGATCSCNLAPLCRRHHRLKTHSSWTYTVLEPGTYLWSSPHGYQFLRDPHGTLDVSRDAPHPRARGPEGPNSAPPIRDGCLHAVGDPVHPPRT